MGGESWLSDLGRRRGGRWGENSLGYWDYGTEWNRVVLFEKCIAGVFGGRGSDA